MKTQERYYLRYDPVDDCHELWQQTDEGDIPQVSFFDGDEQSSPLALLLLKALHAMKEHSRDE